MNKWHLSKKIAAIILAIAIGSILISSVLINLSMNHLFQKYLINVQQTREDQTVKNLVEIYKENGNAWPDTSKNPGFFFRNNLDRLRRITDTNGKTIFYWRLHRPNVNNEPNKQTKQRTDKTQKLTPSPFLKPGKAHLTRRNLFDDNGKLIGAAYFGEDFMQTALIAQNNLFRKTVNFSIIASFFITAMLSFIVALIFGKRISSPIREMNQIAKDMTAGNLNSRVNDLPEDELGELGNSLNALAESLNRVEKLRKEMTANVAHDLRTPLTTVRSHLEGMIDEVIPASTENLDSLLEEVKRLISLVHDLQEVNQADQAIHNFSFEMIEVNTFLQEFVKKTEPLFREKNIGLEFYAEGAATINCDRKSLAKICDNLLTNALKYTPNNKKVIVRVKKNQSTVELIFEDQGIGISAEDLPFIFERFYRTDKSRTRESGGFGLGLTIVKELIEALGGRITAKSQPEVGSTFTITFPLAQESIG